MTVLISILALGVLVSGRRRGPGRPVALAAPGAADRAAPGAAAAPDGTHRSPIRRQWGATHRARAVLILGLLALGAAPTPAPAAPRLRCQIDQGGTSQVLEFAPVADPYGVTAIAINRRFRFKAVVLGNERQIDYINLYTYYQTSRRLVLLHEAKYRAPAPAADRPSVPLTGRNYLYSPGIEREFQYECVLVEAAP